MSAAKQLKTHPKIARANDLYSIYYCVFQLPGTSDFSRRARRYLFFFISLVKAGYTEIRAPMGAIADAIFRAQGQTSSVSTLRTALRELEDLGYLVRRKYRIGHDKSGAVIQLNLERFCFWTRIQRSNVTPIPTHTHNSSCQQNLVGDDRRNTSMLVNSQDPTKIRNKEPRADTRSKDRAKKHQYHPIVYTLMCVLPEGPDRSEMLNLARREISTSTGETSGIDWPYFTKLWPALDPFPGGRRETTAKREIVPLLYQAIEGGRDVPVSRDTGTEDETVEDIRELIGRSLLAVSVDEPGTTEQKISEPENIALSQAELNLLSRAKNGIKNGR
jgi:hypothetical protein